LAVLWSAHYSELLICMSALMKEEEENSPETRQLKRHSPVEIAH
jgi:hypothetical protein